MQMATSRDELVDGREISAGNEDRLGHQEIATELLKLVKEVPPRSNIALFGSWGSGKSGIGNLLGAGLNGNKDYRFARFDAYKYADNPLRRTFIAEIARQLDVSGADKKYGSDLYQGTIDNEISATRKNLGWLALIFFIALAAVTAAPLIIAAVGAHLAHHNIGAAVGAVLAKSVLTAVAPATIVGAIVAITNGTLKAQRTTGRVDSDEEFATLFSELVRDSKAARLIVFVDELDRCAPRDVVLTLDAIRTFFGIDKCIFVVAADLQVLENALTESVQQATPADSANPYYSAGSAYLDKVFQYQVTVPPLFPQSVTSFAVEMVAGRQGVWSTSDVRMIASILIPSHVVSPRRVKTLLNAFALAHRVARARAASGKLDADLNDKRVVEALAKLVCLQVEFPLYARDLERDPRLSEYVIAIRDTIVNEAPVDFDPWGDFPHVANDIQEIADEYARCTRDVDRLMIDGTDAAHPSHTASAAAHSRAYAVQQAQARQLVAYLARTRNITGPLGALIHMQSSGSAFGLSSVVAEQIEAAGRNFDVPNIRGIFAQISAGERVAGIELLTEQVRTAVGVESQNTALTILAMLPLVRKEIGSLAEKITSEVASALNGEVAQLLDRSTLEGVWVLRQHSDREDAQNLVAQMMRSPLFDDDFSTYGHLVDSGDLALAADASRATFILTHWLRTNDWEQALAALRSARPTATLPILAALRSALPGLLAGDLDTYIAYQQAEAAQPAAAAQARPGVVAVASRQQGETAQSAQPAPFDPRPLITAIGAWASDESGQTAELLMALLLTAGAPYARNVVHDNLPKFGTVRSDQLTEQILTVLKSAPSGQWPVWIGALDLSRVAQTYELFEENGGAALSTLWSRGLHGPDDDLAAAARSLALLIDALGPEPRRSVITAAFRRPQAPIDAETLVAYDLWHATTDELATAGLADRDEIVAAEVAALTSAFGTAVPPQAADSDLAADVVAASMRTFDAVTEGARPAGLAELAQAASGCTWLPDTTQLFAELLLRQAADRADTAPLPPLPTADVVASTVAGAALTRRDEIAELWLPQTHDPVDTVLPVVSEWMKSKSSALVAAAERWSGSLAPADVSRIIEPLISKPGTQATSADILRAFGISALSGQEIANTLITRYRAESNNGGREEVLKTWRNTNLRNEKAREDLIRRVLIPMLTLNADAGSRALTNVITLAFPVPKSLRTALGRAIVTASENNKIKDRGAAKLQALGYTQRSAGPLGIKKEWVF
jgi:hypothetical protein